ncbi:MAG: xylulokinase, partial [Clostridia bacterium]|nr:xylulokinase [Clostridia bacterium]
MNYLLGVDLGTSGTKTVLFDINGQPIASATVEYPMYQPHNGWAEQDADDWWEATKSTVRTVLEKSGVDAADVKGLGISGQMHGLVLIDENGNSLCRSLLWCDGRTQAECDEITDAVGAERLIQIAANPALTGFTAGKVLWVRKNQPDVWAKAKYILLPKDYVRYKLTGVVAQEISDASGTNLLDVPGRCWSEEICKAINLDMAMLPPLVESCEVAGTITEEAAKLT